MEPVYVTIRRLERERDRLHRDGVTCFAGEPNINRREVAEVQARIDSLRQQLPAVHVWPHTVAEKSWKK